MLFTNIVNSVVRPPPIRRVEVWVRDIVTPKPREEVVMLAGSDELAYNSAESVNHFVYLYVLLINKTF